MNARILILVFLLNFNFVLYSQFTVSVTSEQVGSCVDSTVQFVAKTIDGVTAVEDVVYTWSFGDGSIPQSGENLDTVTHIFKKGQGYIIRVDAQKGTDSDYALKQFNVSLEPSFEGTKSDRDKPICKGQQIFLTGKVKSETWEYKKEIENIEEQPFVFVKDQNYISTFDYRIFNKDEQITNGNKIDTVGIKLEYKDISTVKIELISPDGASLLLKDFGGASGKSFGMPNASQSDEIGTAYYYYWTNNPDNGTINSATPSGNVLPQGSYQPEQAFSTLAGSSLNGKWQIKLTSNSADNKGFVVASKLVINGEQIFTEWKYSHTYRDHSFPRPEWRGTGVSSTSDVDLATAIPNVYGNHRYTYRVTDDFGCKHDTSLINRVEPANLSTIPDSASGPFDLTMKFENTTSWSESSEWNFGDRTEISTEDAPEHIYTKDGKYFALLTAKTEDGCSDTVSIMVKVTIPPSSLDEIPNAFTPNGDGINDIFKLKQGGAIETLTCHIYSRWGKKVAVWNSAEEAFEKGWDGRVSGGGEASPGVYYYVIKAVGFDGKVYNKKGSFHLFR